MRRALADRGVRAALVLAAVAAAGLAGLGLAWRGAAATLGVWVQMPFVVSGAIGGAALAGCFLGLLGVHLERRAAASERSLLEAALASAAEISETLPTLLEARSRSVRAPSSPEEGQA
jgi:hypothetical protein